MTYIYQLPGWPTFRWNQEALTEQLAAVRHQQGRLIGRMEALGFSLRNEASLEMLTKDVLKSSEIEGEIFNKEQVRSSIVMKKARFWEAQADQPFNDRQRLVINGLFKGFEDKLTSSKYAKLTKCSQDTALRDINDLLKRAILTKDTSGGRSTRYFLAIGA